MYMLCVHVLYSLVINSSLSPYNKPQYITTSLLVLYYVYFLGIYCLQSIFIFSYITLLSIVGENCAVRMRTRLFQCLLEQDISFFDEHKTGELVNRYVIIKVYLMNMINVVLYSR